jgi:bifunctional UDP-N-acetylglucosamine pyrophosphorylase / glucosamine-1-phosphate N-acetyltransferase
VAKDVTSEGLERALVVLAAGKGTRMKSDLPKVLHEIGGRTLVGHVVAACLPLVADGARLRVVVGAGPEGERVARAAHPAEAVVQAEQRGTGHAVRLALEGLGREGTLWVLNGDTPLVPPALLRRLGEAIAEGAAAALVSAQVDDPRGLGRVVRDGAGAFVRVVEERDASPRERAIREVNAAPYAFDLAALWGVIDAIEAHNAQGELYLTDAFALLMAGGGRVAVVQAEDAESVQGINTQAELARAAETYFAHRADDLGRSGVALEAGSGVRVDATAEVRPGAALGTASAVLGQSLVGAGARIDSAARIRDTLVRDGARVGAGAWIDDGAAGPQGHTAAEAKRAADRPRSGPADKTRVPD